MSSKLFLTLGLALAVLSIASWAPAADGADIKLTIVPDGDDNPTEVSIWDEGSPTHLNTEPPIVYTVTWPQPDVTRELDVTADWKGAAQDIGLRLYKQYRGRSFEIPIVHHKLAGADLKKLASQCANNSSVKYAALLDDYYLCRQLFREAKDDSIVKLSAARGWFDTAYRLSILPHTPIRWDTEIANIMQRYEDRAAWNQAFEDRLRGAVQPGYVKQISKDAAIAELRFVSDVDALIKAGELEDALALNRYMWSLYSTLSQETGETIINRVTEKTFADNETLIRTKLESLQKRVSALQ